MSQALTIPPLEGLIAEIQEKRDQSYERKNIQYPRRNPILSDLGECERQMCYSVSNWKDKPPFGIPLLQRFEAGNIWEREIIRELQGLGYSIVLAQQTIEVKGRSGEMLATGRIEGFVKLESRELIPFEIKSLNSNVYNQIDTLSDFQKKPWLRKYIRQLSMYLFGSNKEYGFFILTDCMNHWKLIPIYLDYGECEFLLQRLEKVHAHLKAKTLPDRIEYKGELCGSCPFAQICLPDIDRSEAVILTEDSTLADLDRRGALKPARDEYEALNKGLKKGLKGIESGIAGNWVIIGKERHRDGYAVGPSDFWETRIRPVGRKV